jgi:streptomycin 6-kinase
VSTDVRVSASSRRDSGRSHCRCQWLRDREYERRAKDLHHYNVLSDSGRGWLAIDPKGLVGEVEYEVGAAIRNPIDAMASPAGTGEATSADPI